MNTVKKVINTFKFAYKTNPPYFVLFMGIMAFLIFGGAKVTYSIVTNDNGIVILEGYEHGVGLCGGDGMEKVLFDRGHWMSDGHGNSIFLNPGHGTDEQAMELLDLTTKACAKYHR